MSLLKTELNAEGEKIIFSSDWSPEKRAEAMAAAKAHDARLHRKPFGGRSGDDAKAAFLRAKEAAALAAAAVTKDAPADAVTPGDPAPQVEKRSLDEILYGAAGRIRSAATPAEDADPDEPAEDDALPETRSVDEIMFGYRRPQGDE